ncbi:uncharacterized protein ACNS7B_000249 [Menidia menidia]
MSTDRDPAENFDFQNLLCFETLEDSDTESIQEKTAGKKTEGNESVFSQKEEEEMPDEAVLEKILMEGEINPWGWLEVEEMEQVLMEMADEQENPEPRDKQKKSRKRGRKKKNKQMEMAQVHSAGHYIGVRSSRRGRSRALSPPPPPGSEAVGSCLLMPAPQKETRMVHSTGGAPARPPFPGSNVYGQPSWPQQAPPTDPVGLGCVGLGQQTPSTSSRPLRPLFSGARHGPSQPSFQGPSHPQTAPTASPVTAPPPVSTLRPSSLRAESSLTTAPSPPVSSAPPESLSAPLWVKLDIDSYEKIDSNFHSDLSPTFF